MLRIIATTAAAALAACLAGTPAAAADMKAGGPPPSYYGPRVAPANSWTGAFVGGYAGYGAVTDTLSLLPNQWVRDEARIDGFVGGGFVGYDYETQGALLGIEADLFGGSLGKTWRSPVLGAEYHADLDYVGMVRGRAGYAVGPVLWYVTGGWAYGRIEETVTRAGVGAVTERTSLSGYTVGTGTDIALTPHVFARADYRYFDLGDSQRVVFGVPYTVRIDGHIVTGGVGLKF